MISNLLTQEFIKSLRVSLKFIIFKLTNTIKFVFFFTSLYTCNYFYNKIQNNIYNLIAVLKINESGGII